MNHSCTKSTKGFLIWFHRRDISLLIRQHLYQMQAVRDLLLTVKLEMLCQFVPEDLRQMGWRPLYIIVIQLRSLTLLNPNGINKLKKIWPNILKRIQKWNSKQDRRLSRSNRNKLGKWSSDKLFQKSKPLKKNQISFNMVPLRLNHTMFRRIKEEQERELLNKLERTNPNKWPPSINQNKKPNVIGSLEKLNKETRSSNLCSNKIQIRRTREMNKSFNWRNSKISTNKWKTNTEIK